MSINMKKMKKKRRMQWVVSVHRLEKMKPSERAWFWTKALIKTILFSHAATVCIGLVAAVIFLLISSGYCLIFGGSPDPFLIIKIPAAAALCLGWALSLALWVTVRSEFLKIKGNIEKSNPELFHG